MKRLGEPRRPDPSKSLVGFYVGEVHYALDIARVKEIVNPLEITPLPHTPAEVAGVADHRGDVIPVIDLRTRFALPPVDASRTTKWVLVALETTMLGLIVDRVTDVFGAGGESIGPAPKVGGRADARSIQGVLSHLGVLTFVIDLGKFEKLADALVDAMEDGAGEDR